MPASLTGEMSQLIGRLTGLEWVAIKAALLYLTAVFAFRLGERRTLAEMSAFDFVAAVAVGAIVGRVPNSDTTSYLAGAATLLTVLVCHGIISRLRQFPALSTLFDHPPRILISEGKMIKSELRKAGLTEHDLHGILREKGLLSLEEAHLVIFEQRGKISIVKRSDLAQPDGALLQEVTHHTAAR
jgi:uncharacterized membrane protein YcaP (DUF421 family)